MDIITRSPCDSLLFLISWFQTQEPFKLTAKLLNFPIQACTVGNLFKISVTEKLSIFLHNFLLLLHQRNDNEQERFRKKNINKTRFSFKVTETALKYCSTPLDTSEIKIHLIKNLKYLKDFYHGKLQFYWDNIRYLRFFKCVSLTRLKQFQFIKV